MGNLSHDVLLGRGVADGSHGVRDGDVLVATKDPRRSRLGWSSKTSELRSEGALPGAERKKSVPVAACSKDLLRLNKD